MISSNNKRQQKELDNLEEQKDKKAITEEQYQAQKKAIEEKYAKQEAEIKRQQWKRQHNADIIQSVINGLLAVSKVLYNPPLAIATGAEAAATTALIAATPAPEFREGGYLDGPSHEKGGLKILDARGRVQAYAEGGEPIISKRTARANPDLINALLNARGRILSYQDMIGPRVSYSMPSSSAIRGGSRQGERKKVQSSANSGLHAEMSEMRQMIKQTWAMIKAVDSKRVIMYKKDTDKFANDDAIARGLSEMGKRKS